MKKLILLSLFFIFIFSVRAENETNLTFHDFKLETIVEDKINIETDYDKFFKISYLNHTKGEKEQIFVKVYYNISKNNSLLKEELFNVTVNSYTRANTGNYYFNETGDYEVCGEIISSGINDSNFKNNKACKNFSVISTYNISCNISLIIETEKLIYENGEKVSFKNKLNNDSFKYKIEYWIEDLFGNVYKKTYTTENLNKKSYTPKIDSNVEVLKIIANITYLACNDTNKSDNYFEKLFIVKNDEYKKEKTECPICEEEKEVTRKKGKTELEFTELPNKITVEKDFIIRVLIENNDDTEHEYNIYSYVYRGSKCYSESRENNIKTIRIDKFDSKEIELKDNIKEAEDGEYKIKVKLKQDNLKTEKEIKEYIELINEDNKVIKEENKEILSAISKTPYKIIIKPEEIKEEHENYEEKRINFDYNSNSEKSKKLIKYLILTSLLLTVIAVVFKNE